MNPADKTVLDAIVRRAHYLANQMIFLANHRTDKQKGDPKVGGHSSASSSAIHIMGALHLLVKTGFDHIANKPHASPADHSYNYLMDLFLNKDLSRFTLEQANTVMKNLRAFSQNGEPVFQSYHSAYDPDHHNFFPSGTVGIPPVNAGYLALAYRYASEHAYEVPKAHFWAVMGDSEFREGSLHEAAPDFAERELGNLTWIVDYNRQSLDGHRITNTKVLSGTDADRIERTMAANGWDVIQVRHGQIRQKFFEKVGVGFQTWFETQITDYELQSMLLVKDADQLKNYVVKNHPEAAKFVQNIAPAELHAALHDFGGHDISALAEAMRQSQKDERRPCMIIAHTVKGWNLDMAATPGNHSALPDESEMLRLQEKQGLKPEQLFARFADNTSEGKFLRTRGEALYKDIVAQNQLKEKNSAAFERQAQEFGNIPDSLDINLKMASYPHTQWMLGQLTAKLTRIANTPISGGSDKQKPLTDGEKPWKLPGELLVSMAPDVGTSTNLNPAMDGHIFGAEVTTDIETTLNVKDRKTPDLVPSEERTDRFIRFDIQESNVMSCKGSFGRLRDILGIPLLPLMTVYDFFIKRALDQYFYNLYWKSSFILVGTPSGVTLSPEGAQHGWKSDFQIPNQITWEPFFCVELDWILCDAVRRHVLNDNEGRSGVLIRGVTRGVDQKLLMENLKTQRRFKTGLASETLLSVKGFDVAGGTDESTFASASEEEILNTLKQEVLSGGYRLVSYEGYAGYEPGDNVVNIFAMGALCTEAIKASQKLLEKGIYANVYVVTSPDLLLGGLAHENDYLHLRLNLGVDATLHLQPLMNGHPQSAEVATLSGRRIPVVSVHDGEPGLLDNIGSIIGVRQEALAVRKHSKCGRPVDVYQFHGLDSNSVVEACGKVLSETALEQVRISTRVLGEAEHRAPSHSDWRELWDQRRQ